MKKTEKYYWFSIKVTIHRAYSFNARKEAIILYTINERIKIATMSVTVMVLLKGTQSLTAILHG